MPSSPSVLKETSCGTSTTDHPEPSTSSLPSFTVAPSRVLPACNSNREACPHSIQSLVWASPEDPENPQNWTRCWKAYHLTVAAYVAFIGVLNCSIISLGNTKIEKEFGLTHELSFLPVTLYTLGIAWGLAIAAPLSERYGQLIVYRTTMVLALLFSMGSASTPSFAGLLVCRTLTGLCSGPGSAIWGAVIADVSRFGSSPTLTSVVASLAVLGIPCGPIVGGYVTQYKGWRWTQWCAVIMYGVAALILCFTDETYGKIILQRRVRVLAKCNVIECSEPTPTIAKVQPSLVVAILVSFKRPLHMLCVEPPVICMSLYASFYFGILFGYLDAYPLAFSHFYNFSTSQTGLAFASIAMGAACGPLVSVVVQKILKSRAQHDIFGESPRYCLIDAILASIVLPIALFWFGWTARETVPWYVPCLSGALFGLISSLFLSSMALYLVSFYGAQSNVIIVCSDANPSVFYAILSAHRQVGLLRSVTSFSTSVQIFPPDEDIHIVF